jgi:hypothetical protein
MAFRVIIWLISATIGITIAVVKYQVLDAFIPTELFEALERPKGGADDPPEADELFGESGAKRVVVAAAQDGPGQYLLDGPDGLGVEGPIAAMAGNRPVFIADVIDGYTTRIEADVPAEIMTIRPILGCRLTPPLQGTLVGHVVAGSSGVRTALATYNDTQLAAEVQVFVDAYREQGIADPALRTAPVYEAYDVAVTETGAPVYLVLENRWPVPRLWNIHLAEGARIERVILLGGGQAGVANLDPVVPVEVILHEGLGACGIRPDYPLNLGHLVFQSMANGAMSPAEAEEKLALIDARVAAYDTWFRDSFGVTASESRIGFDEGTISVIGPVPGAADPKAIFAPIKGAKIRTTQDQFFEIQGQVAKGESFTDRVQAIATNFAFGNLDYLRQGMRF